jgi:hypothetical protein
MEILTSFEKRLKIFVTSQIYEVIPIEVFVDMKNLQKIVKVVYRRILSFFCFFECLFKNKPKG